MGAGRLFRRGEGCGAAQVGASPWPAAPYNVNKARSRSDERSGETILADTTIEKATDAMMRDRYDWMDDSDPNLWLNEEFAKGLDEGKRKLFDSAMSLIEESYPKDAVTRSGEPLMRHLTRVAQMIDDMNLLDETVLATLCAYLPKYCPTWQEKLAEIGLKKAAPLIAGLNQLSALTDFVKVDSVRTPEERKKQAESMRKMILAMVDDIRTVIIKLAMRTRTMQYLGRIEDSKEKREIAKETLDIFAPLANRLGLWNLKWQLEDLGFRYCHPAEYREIADQLDGNRDERQRYIEGFVSILRQKLAENGMKNAQVKGRPKHIYSIWRKMQRKHLRFDQLYDIRAARVIVDTVADCYATLGVVHSSWQPISSEFDDYIAKPKANDYQSLHTVVVGPEDKGIEIQIRTYKMHMNAEFGVAAHWKYKEGGSNATTAGYEEKISWLHSLLDWRDNMPQATDEDLAENFKKELFKETIYVLSPKGKVISLPDGSTPIDFAYALHTDVGHRCRGALVDGKMTPLFTKLETGQRVEILTSKTGHPSLDWLQEGWVASPKAINRIKAYLRSLNQDQKTEAGKNLLHKRINAANADVNQQKLAELLGYQDVDELCAALGKGDVTTHRLGRAIAELSQEAEAEKEKAKEFRPFAEKTGAERAGERRAKAKRQLNNGVLIDGESGLLTTLAKCCRPAPPDPIIGFVTRDKGISIHRQGCPSLNYISIQQPEKVLPAEWDVSSPLSGVPYLVQLEIIGRDALLLPGKVIDCLSRHDAHITASSTVTKNDVMSMRFTVEIKNAKETLSKLTPELKSIAEVYSVRRI